jgi:hypothetical protein
VSLVVGALGGRPAGQNLFKYAARRCSSNKGPRSKMSLFGVRPSRFDLTIESKHHRGQPSFTVASVDPNFHSTVLDFPKTKRILIIGFCHKTFEHRKPMARLAAAAHTKTGSLAHNLTSFLSTLGGMKNYTLFGETATFVDPDQPPGHSPQPQSWSSWLRATLTLTAFVHSPNLSWCLIAMGVYILFPYNYTLCRDLTSSSTQSFVLRRTLLHTLVVGSYYTFWFVSLYYKGCGKRKFRGVPSTETAANSTPSPTMATKTNTPPTTYVPPEQLYPSLRSMAHNLYYWALGILQFVCWETCFVHLYATNKISAGNGSLVLLVLGTILVPVW